MVTENQTEFLHEVLKGNRFAIDFCETLFAISQTWDDLVDRDKPVSDKEVNEVFWLALVTLPNNPFYAQNFNVLQPMVQWVITDWLDSNELAKGDDHDKTVAYVLRDSLTSIIVHCARLVGGYAWMRQVGPRVRRALYDEPMTEYKEGLNG